MKSSLFKGIILVAIGASSYGVMATIAKLGAKAGYLYHEMLFAQCFLGFMFLFVINLFEDIRQRRKRKSTIVKTKDKVRLMTGGISIALTSTFYYLSLEYTHVSVCVVMLMQSVWMGAILDYILTGNKPSKGKLFSICLILIGTALATKLFDSNLELDWRGVVFGLLSGLAYTFSLFSSNRIATHYSPLKRSMYLVLGACCFVLIIFGHKMYEQFDFSILWRWGLLLALLGTVLPPLFFTKGMPIIGIGLGSIVASMELPVSITVAYFVLGEIVKWDQWIGILIILLAITLMNVSFKKKFQRS